MKRGMKRGTHARPPTSRTKNLGWTTIVILPSPLSPDWVVVQAMSRLEARVFNSRTDLFVVCNQQHSEGVAVAAYTRHASVNSAQKLGGTTTINHSKIWQ